MSQEEIVVPKGWKLLYFPDVVFFQEGPGLRTFQFKKSGMKVVNVTNLVDNYLNLSKTDRHIDLDEFHKKYKHFAVNEGEILMASSGATFGKTAWVRKQDLPLMMNTSVIRLHNNSNDLDLKFLWYFLKSEFFLGQIKIMITGSAQPNFGPTHLKKSKILLPSTPTQKQIVTKLDHILGELEVKKKEILSLIEQNKERIDFFEKNWMSYVIDREIEKHPQRNEWVETSLGETFDDFNQRWLPSTKNEIVNYIGLENIESNTGNLVNFTPTESLKIKSSKNIFTKNEVLYGKLRPYLNKVHLPEFDGICSTDILSLTPKSNIDRQFLAYFLRSQLVLSHVNKSVHGTKMPRTKIQVLQEFLIQLPDLPIQKQIIQNLKSAEEKFQSQKKQFENIKNNYESKIKYINHIQSSVLDSAFSGKLLN
jgi:type I restriction enzyme, S subunit